MAKKQTIISDINAEQPQITEPVTFTEPAQINVDFISNDEQLLILKSIPSGDLGGIDNSNSNLEINQFSQQDYLEQVAYYAGELLVSLEGIFIGGHAQQVKDQLFVALHNYKNGI